MKTFLALLTITLVTCGAIETEHSDGSLAKNTEDFATSVEGDFENKQDEDRKLVYGGRYQTRYDMKQGWKKSKSNSMKKAKGASYYEESYKHEEGEGEVFIQAMGCPGQCLTFFAAQGFEDSPYVAKLPCDNCDPFQKWRIDTVKGDLIQIYHVKTKQCVCIADKTPQEDACDGDILKFGPCKEHTYGDSWSWHGAETHAQLPPKSLFYLRGGQIYSQFCEELGIPSLVSTSYITAVPAEDYCALDGATGEPIPLAVKNPLLEEVPVTYPDYLFWKTDCLLNPRMCPNESWV